MELNELQEKLGQASAVASSWDVETVKSRYPKNVTRAQLFEALAFEKTNAARIDTELTNLYTAQRWYTDALNTATGEKPPTLAGAVVAAVLSLEIGTHNTKKRVTDQAEIDMLKVLASELRWDLAEVKTERDEAHTCVRAQAVLLANNSE